MANPNKNMGALTMQNGSGPQMHVNNLNMSNRQGNVPGNSLINHNKDFNINGVQKRLNGPIMKVNDNNYAFNSGSNSENDI